MPDVSRETSHQESPMEYCLNCTKNYEDTPGNRPWHLAPCQRCGSDGHSACQHRSTFHVKHRPNERTP